MKEKSIQLRKGMCPKELDVISTFRRRSMSGYSGDEYYINADGTTLVLLEYDNVRITDPTDYYLYDQGVLTVDEEGVTQVLPKEYFNKYFRLKNTLKEA
jgi:hypothetical protein